MGCRRITAESRKDNARIRGDMTDVMTRVMIHVTVRITARMNMEEMVPIVRSTVRMSTEDRAATGRTTVEDMITGIMSRMTEGDAQPDGKRKSTSHLRLRSWYWYCWQPVCS